MASSAIYTPLHLSSFSSSTITKSTIISTSITLNPNSPYFTFTLPSNLLHFTQWSGLKQLSISISTKSVKRETKDKCKGVVFASLFGVGAPEALVIGVVALLVFGPKGLAEVARNLGKTLREFQPTIRELQEVSNEFKSTLGREIGLDEIPTAKRDPFTSNPPPSISNPPPPPPPPPSPTDEPNGSSSPNRAYSTEDYLKITEEQLKATASQQQQEQEQKDQTATSGGQVPRESSSQPQEAIEEDAAAIPTPQKSESET